MRQRMANSTTHPMIIGAATSVTSDIFGGVCDQFGERDARLEQRAHHNAREHHDKDAVSLRPTRYEQHEKHRRDSEAEREQTRGKRARPQKNGNRGSKCRALGRAQDIGRHKRVLEGSLERRACGRKAATHHKRKQNTRQANVEEQRLLLVRPKLVDGKYLAKQHADGLMGLDGELAEHKRDRRDDNQDHGKSHDDEIFAQGDSSPRICSLELRHIVPFE